MKPYMLPPPETVSTEVAMWPPIEKPIPELHICWPCIPLLFNIFFAIKLKNESLSPPKTKYLELT